MEKWAAEPLEGDPTGGLFDRYRGWVEAEGVAVRKFFAALD